MPNAPTDAPTHDVIVVGAGPAGASAAMAARRAGLTVALIDKARFPRDKLCGGGITGRCARHLSQVFDPLPDALFLPTRRVRMVAGRQVLADISDAPLVQMTMRREFDAALQSRAIAAGAEDLSGHRIAEIHPARAALRLADGRDLRARVLIGADGVNSQVARAVFGRAYDPAEIGFGMEVEVPATPSDPDPDPVLELDMTAAAWGYGWAFPKQGGTTIGVGGIASRNADMRAALDAYLQRSGADMAGLRVKGAHLPFGHPRPVPGQGVVLLAGDAAGCVDPITGEGIGWAVKTGAQAAEAAALALGQGDPARALPAYSRATAHMRAEMARARRLRAVVYHPWLQHRFLRLLSREPRLQRRYLSLLAGEMDYGDISLASVPRLLLRMLRGRGA